ncbi:hypothetical protein F2Q70_00040594 [Brassica cretica]|uniref:WRKY domain-containing protein n=1 Tax=Brassica cretica TaxID=69181 RepID=A0A8S9K6X0_BRACR|nr:hypothetical protein F2Q70_00040594 [Brassica cretica]KAF2618292.1 hypothetical protein F2Q68_00041256 [Brassica cretica]
MTTFRPLSVTKENNSSNQDHHQQQQHEQKNQLLSCKRLVTDIFNKANISIVFEPADTPDTSLTVKHVYQWRKYGHKVTRDTPAPRAYFRYLCTYIGCNEAHRIHPYWWLHMKGNITTWIKHCDFGYICLKRFLLFQVVAVT